MVVESDVADNQPDTANFWAKDCCALFGRFSPCSELLFEDANQVGKRVLVRDEIRLLWRVILEFRMESFYGPSEYRGPFLLVSWGLGDADDRLRRDRRPKRHQQWASRRLPAKASGTWQWRSRRAASPASRAVRIVCGR